MTDLGQRVRFFTHLQRLLGEGEFVSTYKFALLLALTRWAVENPAHDERVEVDVGEFAEHYALLYWPHTRPFAVTPDEGESQVGCVAEPRVPFGVVGSQGPADLLRQERGDQDLQVLKLIRAEQSRGAARLRSVPGSRRREFLKKVRQSIRAMPLWRLQTVGRNEDRFLYGQGSSGYKVRFEPGIVRCLAEFSPLIEHVVRAAWLRFVLRNNEQLLSPASQLEDYLFPAGREGLAGWRPMLEAVQGRACFYCDGTGGDFDVDHFLPWSLYARDLGHNFVLACKACNTSKRDHLAAEQHLQRWCQRNERHGVEMAHAFDAVALPHDLEVSRRVAVTLYGIVDGSGAEVWGGQSGMVELGAGWRELLTVA